MTRATNKTPRQIAEEAMAKAQKAALRAAKAESESHPMLAQLNAALDSANKGIADLSRKLNGPNSFANRIASTEARLAWIKAEHTLTNAQDANVRARKDAIQHAIADTVMRLNSGETVTPNDVENILSNLPQDANIGELIVAETTAKMAWKALTAKETSPQVETA